MASYHRVLKVFGRSIQDKTLQCDCDIHPWEILVNDSRWSGRIRLIGFVDVFFLISYSGNSRFHDGIIVYKDDAHIDEILKGDAFEEGKSSNLLLKNKRAEPTPILATNTPATDTSETDTPTTDTPATDECETHAHSTTPSTTITPAPSTSQSSKYTAFSRDTFNYILTSIGHPIGLQTRYTVSSLQRYTISLRKHQDPLLKRKYKNALRQHDTLDMIQDAMKLGLVSYAEVLGHGLSHILRGGGTLDVGKGFVGGLSASKERRWAGLSGDKS